MGNQCHESNLEDAGAGVELHHRLPVHSARVDGEPVSQIQPRKGHQRRSESLGHRHMRVVRCRFAQEDVASAAVGSEGPHQEAELCHCF